jgi:UDP-N-acetylmuramyl tripeptide synthase
MSGVLALKLSLARAVGTLSRLAGRGGTSVPGKVLMRLEPRAISTLGARLTGGSVLVSATNGKTTTAAMAAGVIERAGTSLVHNRAGANMAGGVAAALLAASGSGRGIAGELGLFEVDELWLDLVARELEPRAVVLGNLFRDQLDRYGELESIAERWASDLRARRLVLNADDPLVADLGRDRTDTLYFGVEDDSLAASEMAHAADAKHCRRCGAPYVFDAIYLGHLGHYHCPSCGARRPRPEVIASDVRLEGVRSVRFRLRTGAGEAQLTLALPGLYNVYNALAAAALATALEIDFATIVAGLEDSQAAFGRAESVALSLGSRGDGTRSDGEHSATRELRIMLIKNPAGANEVLRTLVLEPGEHDVLGVLNDNTADGRDVSWIWDADFELLRGRIRRVRCSGTRAAELAVRLKYAGVAEDRIMVEPNLSLALRAAAADAANGAAPLYALPTYTAMLSLRELLIARGEAAEAWR